MIVNLLATWIPALIIALLGVLKLVGHRQVVHELTALGVGRHLRVLGVMELGIETPTEEKWILEGRLTTPCLGELRTSWKQNHRTETIRQINSERGTAMSNSMKAMQVQRERRHSKMFKKQFAKLA